jgi:hypothetical protein
MFHRFIKWIVSNAWSDVEWELKLWTSFMLCKFKPLILKQYWWPYINDYECFVVIQFWIYLLIRLSTIVFFSIWIGFWPLKLHYLKDMITKTKSDTNRNVTKRSVHDYKGDWDYKGVYCNDFMLNKPLMVMVGFNETTFNLWGS